MGVIRRQGITNTITTYIGIVIGFVSLIVISPHFLTKEELGLTRILYSFSLLAAMFVPIGIGNATTKYFPLFKNEKTRHHGYFGFMILFPILGFIICSLIIWIFKDFIMNQYRRESPLFLEYFYYVFPLIFFLSFIGILNIYCTSHFKSTIPAFLNDVVIRVFTIVIITIYYWKWLTLNQFILCYVGIYAIQFLILTIYVFLFDKPGFKIDLQFFRKIKIFSLIRYGLLLWFAAVSSIGLKYFDTIMIGKYLPLGFVGIYTIAAFIPTVIEAPLNAIDKIAASKISFAWADKKYDDIYLIYHKSSLYMLLFGGFLFLNININIQNLFDFLPPEYSQGKTIVIIMSIGTLFNMATGLNSSILISSEKYKYGAAYLILLAILVLIFQMILIPRFGLEGAAIATTVSTFVYNILLTVTVWKFFRLQPFDRKNIRIAMLIIGCFFINYLIPKLDNQYLNIALHTVIISGIYASLVYALKIVPEFNKYFRWQK